MSDGGRIMQETIIHVGNIEQDRERLQTFAKSSRIKLMYSINTWLFDFFRDLNLPIRQLPPLDDWTRKGKTWFVQVNDSLNNISLNITIEEQEL